MPNAPKKLIPYRRVSTAKQGESGLGLEAQDAAIESYRRMHGGKIVKSFTEVESGKDNDRPEMAKALAHGRRVGATVVIAKLDRLTRNARFLLGIVESGADVAFCDLPQIPVGAMGKFFLTLMAAVAELEVGLVSQRTKAALAAYKARGGKLGTHRPPGGVKKDGTPKLPPRKLSAEAMAAGRARSVAVRTAAAREACLDLLPVIQALRTPGTSLASIAAQLNADGHTTRRGKLWTPTAVKRVLDRG